MNRAWKILLVFLLVFINIKTNFALVITTGGTYWFNGTVNCSSNPCIWINTTALVILKGNSTGALNSWGNITIEANYSINELNLVIDHLYIYNASNITYVTNATPLLINISIINNSTITSSIYFMNYSATPQNFIISIENSTFNCNQNLDNSISGVLVIENSTTTGNIYSYITSSTSIHDLAVINSNVHNISYIGGFGNILIENSVANKIYDYSNSLNGSFNIIIYNSTINLSLNRAILKNETVINSTINYFQDGRTNLKAGQLYYYDNHLYINNSKIVHEFIIVPGTNAFTYVFNSELIGDQDIIGKLYYVGSSLCLGGWHALVYNSTVVYISGLNPGIGHNITFKYSKLFINTSIHEWGVYNQTGIHIIDSYFEFSPPLSSDTMYWSNIIANNSKIVIQKGFFDQVEVAGSYLQLSHINTTTYFRNCIIVFNNSINKFNLTNTSDVFNNSTIYVLNFLGTSTYYRNVFNFNTAGVYVGHGYINYSTIYLDNTNSYTNLFNMNYAYIYFNNLTIINNSTSSLNSVIHLNYGSFANITNTSFCNIQSIYSLYFKYSNSSSFIGNIWINPNTVNNLSYILNWPDASHYCNGTPLYSVYNELRIYGRFLLSGPNGVKTPFSFSTKNIPFEFLPVNYSININSAYEPKGEYVIFQEDNTKNYSASIVNLTNRFDIKKEINDLGPGFSLKDKDILVIPFGITIPYFLKSTLFKMIFTYIPMNNIINIELNENSNESLFICSKSLLFGTSCSKYYSTTYIYIVLTVDNGVGLNNYVILIGKNTPGVVSYLTNFGKVVKIIQPTTKTIDINVTKILGINSSTDILFSVDIGIIKYLTFNLLQQVILSNGKIKVGKEKIKQLLSTGETYYFNSTTVINNFKIISYSPGLKYTAPFPDCLIRINNKCYSNFPVSINSSSISINSNLPLILYGNIKLYGNITIPFKQLNTFTYSALYKYLYDHMFVIKKVYLYGLPTFIFRVFHNITRYYYNNSTNVSKTEDLSNYFKLVFGREGICYKLTNPNDFSLVSNILENYYNFELFFNTSWLKREPDIFPTKIIIKTENNSVTDLITTIKAVNISNYTITTNITNILQCGNKTFYYNTTINVSNKTTIYDFNVVPYVYNLSNVVCNYTIELNPRYDIIRSDNSLSTSFYILPQKNGTGNLTVVIYNASSNTIIPGDVYLYYANGTLLASNTTNNGVVNFTNLNFSYYYVVVENTTYEVFNRSFFLGNSTYYIYAYLVPKSISKTKYSVLQICIETKDSEPVQEKNVSIYFTNGTLYKVIKVNSTGCGSTIVPANLSYKLATFVNLTWYNQTIFAYPITVKPYTESIIKTNVISNNIEPEAMIIYAKTYAKFQQSSQIPVFYAIYSSIPQNVTVNITLQELVGTTWENITSIQYNMTFKQFKQVKTNSTALQVNATNVSTYRYMIVIYPENDTNTSNNIAYTQNFTVFPEIDYSLMMLNSVQNVKPNQKINITLMLNGTIKSQCNISILEQYKDPYTVKEVTKTIYLNLTTNNSTNLTFTVPYTNYLVISAKIRNCYLLKMDMNSNNNNQTANQTEISDARIILVKYPKVTHSKNVTLNITIISNYPLNLWVNVSNGSSYQVVPVKFGNNSYLANITIAHLKSYSYNNLTVEISGDEDPYMNTYNIKILYISPKYTGIIFIIIIIVAILIGLGIVKKLLSLNLGNREFRYAKYRKIK